MWVWTVWQLAEKWVWENQTWAPKRVSDIHFSVPPWGSSNRQTSFKMSFFQKPAGGGSAFWDRSWIIQEPGKVHQLPFFHTLRTKEALRKPRECTAWGSVQILKNAKKNQPMEDLWAISGSGCGSWAAGADLGTHCVDVRRETWCIEIYWKQVVKEFQNV